MANNKVYNGVWATGNILPAGLYASTFRIFSQRRVMKIKSIYYAIQIFNISTGLMVPEETNTELFHALGIGSLTNRIGSTYQYQAGGVLASNGTQIQIYKSGSFQFDSFYVNEILDYNLALQNMSAANTLAANIGIVTEVEEQIQY